MKEPNLGITMGCIVCGKSFWCEDGVPLCSTKCSEIYEQQQEEEGG